MTFIYHWLPFLGSQIDGLTDTTVRFDGHDAARGCTHQLRCRMCIVVRARADDERGGVLVMVVFWIPVSAVVLTFVVDVGNWFEHKRHLQMQADAAALAGARGWRACPMMRRSTTARGQVRRGRVQRPGRYHPARARLPADQQQDLPQPAGEPGRHVSGPPVRRGDARRQADRGRPPMVPPVVLQRRHRRRRSSTRRRGCRSIRSTRAWERSRSAFPTPTPSRRTRRSSTRRRAPCSALRTWSRPAPATAWPSGTTPAPHCR